MSAPGEREDAPGTPNTPRVGASATDHDSPRESILRLDRYTIRINEHHVRANDEQERQLRAMTAEQRAMFSRIMGGAQ